MERKIISSGDNVPQEFVDEFLDEPDAGVTGKYGQMLENAVTDENADLPEGGPINIFELGKTTPPDLTNMPELDPGQSKVGK